MAYGTIYSNGRDLRYLVNMQHTSGVTFQMVFGPVRGLEYPPEPPSINGTPLTEPEIDQLFQDFMDQIAGMPDFTSASGIKAVDEETVQDLTPTP